MILLLRFFRFLDTTLAVGAAAQKLSSPPYYNNQSWNSSKPGFGQQKADKTETLMQESSLITGGFR